MFWILTSYPIHGCKNFLSFCSLPFNFVDSLFFCEEMFEFKVTLFVDFCCCLCFWYHVQKNYCQDQYQGDYSQIFFYQFYGSGAYIWAFGSFWIIFLWDCGPVLLCCMCVFSFLSIICWINCPFHNRYSWIPCWICIDCVC